MINVKHNTFDSTVQLNVTTIIDLNIRYELKLICLTADKLNQTQCILFQVKFKINTINIIFINHAMSGTYIEF